MTRISGARAESPASVDPRASKSSDLLAARADLSMPRRGAFDGRAVRMLATSGAYGVPSTGAQEPIRTRTPSSRHLREASATSRVFPIPARPPTRATAGALDIGV